MRHSTLHPKNRQATRAVGYAAFALAWLAGVQYCAAQDTPLISGGAGVFTPTNGGNTSYLPIIEPLIAAPIGPHVLVESRATLLESFAPGKSGYDHSHFAGFTYLQGDYIAS